MIYGHYYKTLKKSNPTNESCPNCQAKGMELEVICKVDHIMFIPCWAGSKETVVSCPVCRKRYYLQTFPDLYNAGEELRQKSRRKYYHYTGLILFLFLIASIGSLIYTDSKEQKEKRLSAIENIRQGDVIYYKLANNKKTSMVVDIVAGDSVFVRENTLSTNKDIRAIDEDYYYSDKQSLYMRSELYQMNKNGLIIKIY